MQYNYFTNINNFILVFQMMYIILEVLLKIFRIFK